VPSHETGGFVYADALPSLADGFPWPSSRTAIRKKKCALPSPSRYVQQRRTQSGNVSQCLNLPMKS
jgi:hypothetical protein